MKPPANGQALHQVRSDLSHHVSPSDTVVDMAQASAAANRILGLRARPKSEDGLGPVKSDGEPGGAEIEFKNVYFKYPTRDVPVFRDVSFKIKKGQYTALVGPSGCGKTSVISLLERFYDIQSGSITYDGAELSSLDLTEYRKKLSLVSQEPTLYQGESYSFFRT